VLFSILLSVTNVGVYRETGWRIRSMWKAMGTLPQVVAVPLYILLYFFLFLVVVAAAGIMYHNIVELFGSLMPDLNATPGILLVPIALSVLLWWGLSLILGVGVAVAVLHLIIAFIVAWRWILITVGFFAALVVINEVYVLWLEPLVAH
jgi:hypothetical protein